MSSFGFDTAARNGRIFPKRLGWSLATVALQWVCMALRTIKANHQTTFHIVSYHNCENTCMDLVTKSFSAFFNWTSTLVTFFVCSSGSLAQKFWLDRGTAKVSFFLRLSKQEARIFFQPIQLFDTAKMSGRGKGGKTKSKVINPVRLLVASLLLYSPSFVPTWSQLISGSVSVMSFSTFSG